MVTLHDYYSGKIIRKATKKEYERYKKELSKKSKEGQLSGEVSGEPYGVKRLVYMQDYPIEGFDE